MTFDPTFSASKLGISKGLSSPINAKYANQGGVKGGDKGGSWGKGGGNQRGGQQQSWSVAATQQAAAPLSNNLFVSQLQPEVTEEALMGVFGAYGTVS